MADETKTNKESSERKPREKRIEVLTDILKNGTLAEKKAVEKLVNGRKTMKELVTAVTDCCKLNDKVEAIKAKLVKEGLFSVEELNQIVADTEKKFKEKKEKNKKG